MHYPKVSIVIPAKKANQNLHDCIENCLLLDYPDFEIFALPDSDEDLPFAEKVRVVPTGKVGPAEKRDMVIPLAKGEIIAFLDDDAFPREDWLKNAVKHFENDSVAAVGGPGVTPETDSSMQKASGLVYSSFLCSGNLALRYVPTKKCEVDDYPSCNFHVRKSVMEKIGGFDTRYWPGEDTLACLRITNDLNRRIIYAPDVLVYHHRRPLFLPHLKQVWSYAVHRGYFAKKFPETSFRLTYFLPTLFVFGLSFGLIAAFANFYLKIIYFALLSLYLLAIFVTALQGKSPKITIAVFLGIILTHVCYGIGFLKGLVSKKLKEEN